VRPSGKIAKAAKSNTTRPSGKIAKVGTTRPSGTIAKHSKWGKPTTRPSGTIAKHPVETNSNVGSSRSSKTKKKINTGLKAPATVSSSYSFPPILPDPYIPDPPPPPVRVPERDVVELLNQTVDAATIQNLLFENIGANELTKFVRHDTVEGINPYYNIISNLSDIKRKFDPASLVSLQKNDSSLFDIYAIKLDDKIPTDNYLEQNNLSNYVYFDSKGNLVIEVVNMSDSELVEVEIDRNGTIYEVEEL